MPIVTDHPNEEVDSILIEDILAEVPEVTSVSEAEDAIDALIARMSSSETVVSEKKLVGDGTLKDGGLVGKMLNLYRSHTVASLKAGELTKTQVGEVYANMLGVASESAVAALSKQSESINTTADALARMIVAKVNFSTERAKLSTQKYQMANEAYKLKVFSPLEREKMKEDIEKLHIDHEAALYNYRNIMPVELGSKVKSNQILDMDYKQKKYQFTDLMPIDKTIKTHEASGLSIDNSTKSYNLSDLMPLDKSLKTKEGILLDKDATLKDKESTLLSDKHNIESYTFTDMLPVEKLIKTEEHSTMIVDKDIKSYNLDNILPINKTLLEKETTIKDNEITLLGKDALLKDGDIVIKTKEATLLDDKHNIENYTFTDMLPLQKSKISAEISLIGSQQSQITSGISLQTAEKLIKDYYRLNIQPEEYNLTKAKAFIEKVNAGDYVIEDSLPFKKIEQVSVQTDLYARQIGTYDDVRYQKLLNTVMNYNAMIFPDNTSEDKLIEWASRQTTGNELYEALKPPTP